MSLDVRRIAIFLDNHARSVAPLILKRMNEPSTNESKLAYLRELLTMFATLHMADGLTDEDIREMVATIREREKARTCQR